MAVFFSTEVRKGIIDFWDSLPLYGISYQRAIEKYNEMRNALTSLDNAIYYRICPYKDLGQILDRSGKPLFPFLYIYIYVDRKSKNKWSFSYVIDTNGDVYIVNMKYSKLIKEDKIRDVIHITEDNLRNIIKECLLKYINKNA